eukprot:CAMPEP_0171074308 /NCGR_PEP_ID=MMETSP0766_2-20121228/12056_1 /TAXON_ID=439317 /ORGANISM="Gambierdiscus australes, Strain CAWD 149" /LENGTH=130 /DNA_ID=CAMNT_0011531079 /DNA_START=227 /DNA_END=619 /DNA_ORIENTATION=-
MATPVNTIALPTRTPTGKLSPKNARDTAVVTTLLSLPTICIEVGPISFSKQMARKFNSVAITHVTTSMRKTGTVIETQATLRFSVMKAKARDTATTNGDWAAKRWSPLKGTSTGPTGSLLSALLPVPVLK